MSWIYLLLLIGLQGAPHRTLFTFKEETVSLIAKNLMEWFYHFRELYLPKVIEKVRMEVNIFERIEKILYSCGSYMDSNLAALMQ